MKSAPPVAVAPVRSVANLGRDFLFVSSGLSGYLSPELHKTPLCSSTFGIQ